MGWLVGDADGLWLGCDVGLNVAGVVGLAVKVVGLDVTGLAEGDTLGPTVGFKLGDDVGLVLGLPVTGFAVGDEVGTLVGWKQQVICISFEFLSIIRRVYQTADLRCSTEHW